MLHHIQSFTRNALVEELYDGRNRGLEQRFRIGTGFEGGELRIEGRVTTALFGRYDPRFGMVFTENTVTGTAGADDRIVYSNPVVIDADGSRFRGELHLTNDLLSIRFSEAQVADMQFPIVVDPVIGDGIELGLGSQTHAIYCHELDEYAVVYKASNNPLGDTIIFARYNRDGYQVASYATSLVGNDPTIAYSRLDGRYGIVAAQNGAPICESGQSNVMLEILNSEGESQGTWILNNGTNDTRCYHEPQIFVAHGDLDASGERVDEEGWYDFTIVWTENSESDRRIVAERVSTYGDPYGDVDDFVLFEESAGTKYRNVSLAYSWEWRRLCATFEGDGLKAIVVDSSLQEIYGPTALPGAHSSVTWTPDGFAVVWEEGEIDEYGCFREHNVILGLLDADCSLGNSTILLGSEWNNDGRDQTAPSIQYSARSGETFVVYLDYPFSSWDPDYRHQLWEEGAFPWCHLEDGDPQLAFTPRVFAAQVHMGALEVIDEFELHWDMGGSYYPDSSGGWRSEAAAPAIAQMGFSDRFFALWEEKRWLYGEPAELSDYNPNNICEQVVWGAPRILGRLFDTAIDTNPPPPDYDWDDDGLLNHEEYTHQTNPMIADTDGDGLSDGAEVHYYGTNPTLVDSDGDGLADGAEVLTHGTSPTTADTDGDGVNDGVEIEGGSNPNDRYSVPSTFVFTTAPDQSIQLRAEGLVATFTAQGATIFENDGESGASVVTYRLQSVMAESVTLFAATTTTATQPAIDEGLRVRYVHNSAVTEFYEPHGGGVEQFFTIQQAPPSGEGLRILGVLGTDLVLTRELGQGIALRRPATEDEPYGELVALYGDPIATDANGVVVHGRLGLEDNVAVLSFDGQTLSELEFPITIDPLIVIPYNVAWDSSTSLSTSVGQPAVARNSDRDEVLVTYVKTNGSQGDELWCARLDSRGILIGNRRPVLTATTPPRKIRAPDVAYSPVSKRFATVCASWVPAAGTYQPPALLLSILDDTGRVLTTRSLSPLFSVVDSPRVTYVGADQFVVTWVGSSAYGTVAQRVYAERIDASGATLIDDKLLADGSTTGETFTHAALAYDASNNRICFAWSGVTLTARITDASLVPLATAPAVSLGKGGPVDVAWIDAAGVFQVVWGLYQPFGFLRQQDHYDVVMQRVSANGVTPGAMIYSGPQTVARGTTVVSGATTQLNESRPRIAYNPAGDALVVYQAGGPTSPSGTWFPSTEVRGRHILADGSMPSVAISLGGSPYSSASIGISSPAYGPVVTFSPTRHGRYYVFYGRTVYHGTPNVLSSGIRGRTLPPLVPTNTTPTAQSGSLTTPENTPVNIPILWSDADGDPLTVVVDTQPRYGSVLANFKGGAHGRYLPNPGFSGADAFTYHVTDGTTSSAAATIWITVTPVNNAPSAQGRLVRVARDVPISITLTGSDPDGSSISFQITSGPSIGTLSGLAPRVTYAPMAGFVGADAFTYTVSDGVLTSAPATISVSVEVGNLPPLADAQSQKTREGISLPLTLQATDPNGDALTYTVTSLPQKGTLEGVAPNLMYRSFPGAVGPDLFTFTASDGTSTSAAATVDIRVQCTTLIFVGGMSDYAWFSSGPGAVTVVADAERVEIGIAPLRSLGQIAQQIHDSLYQAGIGSAARGRVVEVYTDDFPADVFANVPYLTISKRDGAEPAPGFRASQIGCCPTSGSNSNPQDLTITSSPDPEIPPPPIYVPPGTTEPSTPSCPEPYRGDTQIGSGIFAQSGEFGFQKTYLNIAGRGMDYDLTLTYRSQSASRGGEVGPGWSHNWKRSLQKQTVNDPVLRAAGVEFNLVLNNGYGRADVFHQVSPGNFVDGPGIFKSVTLDGVWAHVRDRYGNVETFALSSGLLDRVVDRNGNRISVFYTSNCNVKTIVDTLGRTIEYDHMQVAFRDRLNQALDYEERLYSVRDFSGRLVTIDYAQGYSSEQHHQGDLTSITGPEVTSSPGGLNNFAGRVTTFKYATDYNGDPGAHCTDAPIKHNILEVRESGDLSIQNIYGTQKCQSPTTFDRVVSQNVELRGYASYSYNFDGCTNGTTTEVDRRGVTRTWTHDIRGHLVQEMVTVFTTSYVRNPDGLILELTNPDGSRVVNEYYPPPIGTSDPIELMRRGNRLRSETIPEATRGGSPSTIFESWTYDPVYNQVLTHTDVRGFTTTYEFDWQDAVTGGGTPHESVQTVDWNGNGVVDADMREIMRGGNVARIKHPDGAVEHFRYNQFGQETHHVRAQGGVVDISTYFAEDKPDGAHLTLAPPDGRTLDTVTGGHLRSTRVDATPPSVWPPLFVPARTQPTPPVDALTEYERDLLGRVTLVIDPRGIGSSTEYNELGQVYRERHAWLHSQRADPAIPVALNLETLTYFNIRGRVAQVDRKIGNPDTPDGDFAYADYTNTGYASTVTRYDQAGNPTATMVELSPNKAAITERVFDANGNLKLVRSPVAVAGVQVNNTTESEYDDLNRPTEVTRAKGTPEASTVTTSYYFSSSNPDVVVDGRGQATTTVYDGYGRAIRTIDALGGERHTVYNAAGLVDESETFGDVGPRFEDDPASHQSVNVRLAHEQYEYDERGRRTKSRSSYFLREDPATSTPETSIMLDGDGDGWIEATTDYDLEGRAVLVTADNGSTTTTTYDGLGRAVAVEDAGGNRAETTYDAGGNVVATVATEASSLNPSVTESFISETLFDAASRAVQTTDNMGGVSYRSYDALSHAIEAIDELGNAVRSYFDAGGRAIRTEWVLTGSGFGPGNGVVGTPDSAQGGGNGLIWEDMAYDVSGRTVLRKDDNGNETHFDYNNRDLLRLEMQADGTTATATYDANGNVIERIDYNGTKLVQLFDPLNRLVRVDAVVALGNPHDVVESGARELAYDGLSRMVLALEANGAPEQASRVHYTYDSAAHVVSERQGLGFGTSASVEYAIHAAWSGMGSLLTLAYPSSALVERTHDDLERVTAIQESTWIGDVAAYAYMGAARVTERSSNSANLSTVIQHDGLRRPFSVASHWASTNDLIAETTYGFDAASNRLWERREHEGGRGRAHAYDSAYRLTSSNEAILDGSGVPQGSPITEEGYTYDGVGNRITRTGTVLVTYTANNLNQYTSVGGQSVDYDANGNLTQDATTEYRYDAFNRLRRLENQSGVAEYTYDARGRRVRKTFPSGGDLTFAYFESRAIEEYAQQGAALAASYVFGLGVDEVIVKRLESGDLHWHCEDGLGNVIAVVGDGNNVLERYRYEAYGKPAFLDASGNDTSLAESAIGNRILFTGREFEAESGLYFYRARYYSPGLGRFLSRDPAGYVDGLNLYAYVRNNPVNRVDPTGLFLDAVKGFGMGLLNTAVGLAVGVAKMAASGAVVMSSPSSMLNPTVREFVVETSVEAAMTPIEIPRQMAGALERCGKAIEAGNEFAAGEALGDYFGNGLATAAAAGGVGSLAKGGGRLRTGPGELVDSLVQERTARVQAGSEVGEATFARAVRGEFDSGVVESSPTGGTMAHAERTALARVSDGQGPVTLAVDQKPCPGANGCQQFLQERLPPGSQVFVPENPASSGTSPKSAARAAAQGRIPSVRPRLCLETPKPSLWKEKRVLPPAPNDQNGK